MPDTPWTSGENIVFDVSEWNYGYYAVVLRINDGLGNMTEDQVIVRVQRDLYLDTANALAIYLGFGVPAVILVVWEIHVRTKRQPKVTIND